MISSISLKHWYFYIEDDSILILMSRKWVYCSIWAIDWTGSSISTPGQSGPVSNGNEVVLHIPQILWLEPHQEMLFKVTPRTPILFDQPFHELIEIWQMEEFSSDLIEIFTMSTIGNG